MPPKHHNPHPKFRKPYLSWKGRAQAMRAHLELTGHVVRYGTDSAWVMVDGQIINKPKRWWQVWKWW